MNKRLFSAAGRQFRNKKGNRNLIQLIRAVLFSNRLFHDIFTISNVFQLRQIALTDCIVNETGLAAQAPK